MPPLMGSLKATTSASHDRSFDTERTDAKDNRQISAREGAFGDESQPQIGEVAKAVKEEALVAYEGIHTENHGEENKGFIAQKEKLAVKYLVEIGIVTIAEEGLDDVLQ